MRSARSQRGVQDRKTDEPTAERLVRRAEKRPQHDPAARTAKGCRRSHEDQVQHAKRSSTPGGVRCAQSFPAAVRRSYCTARPCRRGMRTARPPFLEPTHERSSPTVGPGECFGDDELGKERDAELSIMFTTRPRRGRRRVRRERLVTFVGAKGGSQAQSAATASGRGAITSDISLR